MSRDFPKIRRRRACITATIFRTATLRHQVCNDDEFSEKIRVQANGVLPSRVQRHSQFSDTGNAVIHS